jgi:hypothetical protein
VSILLAKFVWWQRLICQHHWHAFDAMIAWDCCWCGKEIDASNPRDRTAACRRGTGEGTG